MTLNEKMELMIKYMHLKISERDWHGVADCAMDLREMEVEKKYWDAVVKPLEGRLHGET